MEIAQREISLLAAVPLAVRRSHFSLTDEDHQEKREEWAERLEDLDIDLDSDRKR